MASFGLDSSVLVRLLTGQPVDAFLRAERFVRESRRKLRNLLVSDMVVAETWYALKIHYHAEPALIRDKLQAMFASGLIRPEPHSGVMDALSDEQGAAGFVDRLIVARYAEQGAITLTFDASQAKLPGAKRL